MTGGVRESMHNSMFSSSKFHESKALLIPSGHLAPAALTCFKPSSKKGKASTCSTDHKNRQPNQPLVLSANT